ncbi:MAG: 4,5-DOPA dioxygenase extradiol [Woeseia sp.]
MNGKTKMPVVFFGHGSPTNVMEDNRSTQTWQRIGASLPKPKAILCVSAHWCTHGTSVTAMNEPRTIHDFGRSLPAPLFDYQYPAPGDPALAARVAELLQPVPVTMDESRGLDHGAWSVLLKAYPQADIPVVQLSIDVTQADAWHFETGRHLKPLRNEGVLIVGSGNIVHNLGVMDWDEQATPYDWAVRFNDYVRECIKENDIERLLEYPKLSKDAALSLPGPDHFWPLLYALGARDGFDVPVFDPDFIQYKSLSMTSIVFGA